MDVRFIMKSAYSMKLTQLNPEDARAAGTGDQTIVTEIQWVGG
jgi:hypothetical protein